MATVQKEAAAELQSLRTAVGFLRCEAFHDRQNAARVTLTHKAATERIALAEQEAAERKPIQLRDDALAEEEAQLLISNNNGDANEALITACEEGKTIVAVRLVRHHRADVRYIEWRDSKKTPPRALCCLWWPHQHLPRPRQRIRRKCQRKGQRWKHPSAQCCVQWLHRNRSQPHQGAWRRCERERRHLCTMLC